MRIAASFSRAVSEATLGLRLLTYLKAAASLSSSLNIRSSTSFASSSLPNLRGVKVIGGEEWSRINIE